MKVLELFKGTGSVGKVCAEYGWQVTSLDIDPKYNPDITCDIMQWDYKAYRDANGDVPKFDIIWASPLCTYYSKMQDIANRHRKDWVEEKRCESDIMIKQVLDIIEHFKPTFWFLENPQTGYLKSRDVLKGIPFVDADYCKYGYPYAKRTRFWGTVADKTLLKCKKDCNFSDGTSHFCSVGISGKNGNGKAYKMTPAQACERVGLTWNLSQRYSIPRDLLRDLLSTPPQKIIVNITKKAPFHH